MSKWEQYKIEENNQPVASKWAKYRVAPIIQEEVLEPEGDSWTSFLPKAGLKAVTNIADIPSAVENLAAASMDYSPVSLLSKYFGGPSIKHKPILPTTSDARAKIKEYTGVDLEPKPSSAAQRITGNVLDFAAPGGMFGKAAKAPTTLGKIWNTAKPTVGAGAVGAGSGALQEMGVNPLLADIGATLTPYGATQGVKTIGKLGGKLILSPEESARRILKNQIGEKNLPKVIESLDTTLPFNVPANTAELAQNTGVSALHRAMSPNIPAIAEKQAAADTILRNQINTISPASGQSAYRSGEIIRGGLDKNLTQAHQMRSSITEPLYDALYGLDQGVKLPQTKEFLQKEGKFAKGDIKRNLDYIENLIASNKASSKSSKAYENALKEYEGLSPAAKEKLFNELTPSNPVPGELKGALTEITDKYKSAKKAGNDNLARIYKDAKDNILSDMSYIPEERVAREIYANLSKPISAIEKEPLLKRFVKKDEFNQDYLLSPEKIPQMILGGSTNNTKALMKQAASNPKMLQTIRGSFIDEMFNKASLSSINARGEQNISYDKFNKFLKQNKGKLELVFDKNQMQVLNDSRELLKRRNMVQTMGRAVGSNTQSETTLLAQLTSPLGKIGQTTLKFIPGGKKMGQIARPVFEALQSTQKQAIKDILADALIDPEKAKLLLTPTKDIKSVDQLNTILARLTPISNTSVEELQKQYPNAITIDSMGGQ